jgi:hypothetical protein
VIARNNANGTSAPRIFGACRTEGDKVNANIPAMSCQRNGECSRATVTKKSKEGRDLNAHDRSHSQRGRGQGSGATISVSGSAERETMRRSSSTGTGSVPEFERISPMSSSSS